MRSAATVLLWFLTVVLLAAALPVMWAQRTLVNEAGYSALAQRAGTDPRAQSAMASELAAQVNQLSGDAAPGVVDAVAQAYTAGPAFPGQFARASVLAHRWLFSGPADTRVDDQGRWVIDLAPMLADRAFGETLRSFGIAIPSELPVALPGDVPPELRPGSLREVAFWAPWLAWTLTALAACSAVLMLRTARRRGRALVALGVAAVLAGAGGWAAVELTRPRVEAALQPSTGTARAIAEVMIAAARDSAHEWLNVTLIAGAGLVVVGVVVSLMSAVGERR